MPLRRLFATLAFVWPLTCGAASDSSRLVAMLEDLHHTGRNDKTLEQYDAYQPAVRVAFVSENGTWRSACPSKPFHTVSAECTPPELTQLTSWFLFIPSSAVVVETDGIRPRETCCSDVGLLRVANSTPFSSSAEKLFAFSGWGGIPKAKPRVVVPSSVLPTTRRDTWQRVTKNSGVPEWARKILEERWLREKNCSMGRDGTEGPAYGTKLRARDLRVGSRFVSPKDGELVELLFSNEYRKRCLGMDNNGTGIWAARPTVGKPRLVLLSPLVSNLTLDNLLPLEQGDFDGNGRPEFIFWYSGYNQDGYVLLSDSLSKTTTFLWGYH